MQAAASVSVCWQLRVKGLFLHSHFPWRCVTGPPWSFVSLQYYISCVGWTDRQQTEDRPVELKELLCLEACPIGQNTAAHWWGTEENSTRVGNYHQPLCISRMRAKLTVSQRLNWKSIVTLTCLLLWCQGATSRRSRWKRKEGKWWMRGQTEA